MTEFSDLTFNRNEFSSVKNRLSDYFGIWAIEPTRFGQTWNAVRGMNLSQHVRDNLAIGAKTTDVLGESDVAPSPLGGGAIAEIHLSGSLTKAGCSIDGSSSMVAVRHQIRAAARDSSIDGILLIIDSPGGTVAGTEDLSNEVAAAAKTKPVYAVIEDLGASAAYWVASQATKVFAANKTTLVGSIGTFMVLYDYSKTFEDNGIRAVLVKAGQFKGAGTPGTEITDEQVVEHQKIVDGLQAQFTAHVQRGRGFSDEQAKALVTGLVYTAETALSMQLIDGIQSIDETLQLLQLASREAQTFEGDSMSQNNTGKAASFNEIVAACPGLKTSKAEDAQFVVSAQQRGLSSSEANREWCEALVARVDIARAEQEEAEEELEQSRKSRKSRKSNTDEEQQSRRSRKSEDTVDDEQAEDEEDPPAARKSRRSKANDEDQQQSRKSRRSRAEDEDPESEDDQTDDFASEDEEDVDAEDEEEQPSSRYRRGRARSGVRTIGTRSHRSGHASANAAFKAEVEKLMSKHPNMPRNEAVRKVYAAHPDLQEAVVAEANAVRRRK